MPFSSSSGQLRKAVLDISRCCIIFRLQINMFNFEVESRKHTNNSRTRTRTKGARVRPTGREYSDAGLGLVCAIISIFAVAVDAVVVAVATSAAADEQLFHKIIQPKHCRARIHMTAYVRRGLFLLVQHDLHGIPLNPNTNSNTNPNSKPRCKTLT